MAMYPLTLGEITSAVNGRFFGPEESRSIKISNVTHDSRKVSDGSLFVCIKGARADGHDFAPATFEKGAVCALAERPLPEGCTYILVESVMDALRHLSAYYRKCLPIPVVGIIGSVGKTTAKEMISSVCSRRYKVLKTPANLNNELGVPLTVLSIEEEHDVAVIEMGISDFGEMTRLSYMVRPDIAVFTAIGHCHLEQLGDLDGVLRAKSEVFTYMGYDSLVVLNGDDATLKKCRPDMQTVSYGLSENCDFIAGNVKNRGFDGTSCTICRNFTETPIEIPAYGSHMVYAALAAYVIGHVFNIPEEEIARGIADYRAIDGRANVIKGASVTVIDDCYNANPNSMSASLRSLSALGGRRVAVLGDMKELTDSAALHAKIGALAADLGIDMLFTVGEDAENIHAAFAEKFPENTRHFASKADLYPVMDALLKADDTVLVKASHSMGFDEIVAHLKEVNV